MRIVSDMFYGSLRAYDTNKTKVMPYRVVKGIIQNILYGMRLDASVVLLKIPKDTLINSYLSDLPVEVLKLVDNEY